MNKKYEKYEKSENDYLSKFHFLLGEEKLHEYPKLKQVKTENIMIDFLSEKLNQKNNEDLGRAANTLVIFLKIYNTSVTNEEIIQLIQEAKDSFRKAGREDLAKKVEENN